VVAVSFALGNGGAYLVGFVTGFESDVKKLRIETE